MYLVTAVEHKSNRLLFHKAIQNDVAIIPIEHVFYGQPGRTKKNIEAAPFIMR
jgi:hypothetical protein